MTVRAGRSSTCISADALSVIRVGAQTARNETLGSRELYRLQQHPGVAVGWTRATEHDGRHELSQVSLPE
jgi:chloramphenicol 3-O-phosphotransferase